MGGIYRSIFTSSLFIIVIILLRGIFRQKISMRLQYALWLFAAVKLLAAPFPQPESAISVQRLSGAWENLVQEGQGKAAAVKQNSADAPQEDNSAFIPAEDGMPDRAHKYAAGQGGRAAAEASPRGIGQICTAAAGIGCILMFLYFLTGNIRFALYLRRNRTRFTGNAFPLPVFLAEGLPSPCLYGRAVYITPAAAADERRLLHVLAHEYCHYRQGDPAWSMLRCLCIILYWWNPLVWLAADLSKQDCELACDEAALHLLGEGERISYGRTLISLVTVREKPGDYFSIAAMMTERGRNMKQRIQRISHKNKAAASVSILALFLAAACFISASTAKPASGRDQEAPTPAGRAQIPADDSGKDVPAAEEDRREEPSDAVFDLDEAAGLAVLSHNEDRYGQEECVAEGHIMLADEAGKGGLVKVYALTMCGGYQFHDGYFVKECGTGVIPVVMKFSYDDRQGYVLKAYQEPEDGMGYAESVRRRFPEKLWEACISVTEEDTAELTRQEQNCAKRYLKQIGRKAPVENYPDDDHPLLTDAGVSVKAADRLHIEKLADYPDWIGCRELVEDGVRYQYTLSLDPAAEEIVFTKSEYNTGKITEEFRFDMNTGKEKS